MTDSAGKPMVNWTLYRLVIIAIGLMWTAGPVIQQRTISSQRPLINRQDRTIGEATAAMDNLLAADKKLKAANQRLMDASNQLQAACGLTRPSPTLDRKTSGDNKNDAANR